MHGVLVLLSKYNSVTFSVPFIIWGCPICSTANSLILDLQTGELHLFSLQEKFEESWCVGFVGLTKYSCVSSIEKSITIETLGDALLDKYKENYSGEQSLNNFK
ncbi:uncharacterized protein [Leptinotarsa decemlineata]|uniref:uncharacterized protein n=1 Tax=Leptinotarsa decemlineata TaxID=7539 RepID=UPI003D304C28